MTKYNWISTGTWNLETFFLLFFSWKILCLNLVQHRLDHKHVTHWWQERSTFHRWVCSPEFCRREGGHWAATPVRRHLIVKLLHYHVKYMSVPPSFNWQGIKQGIALTSAGFRSMPPLCYKSAKPLWEALKHITGYPIPTSCRRAIIWHSNCQFSVTSVKHSSP